LESEENPQSELAGTGDAESCEERRNTGRESGSLINGLSDNYVEKYRASDQGVEGWSSRDKFAAVIESAAMNAEEIAAYCRQHGWPLAPLLNTLRWHVESLRKMDPPSAELESQATAAEHPFEGRIDACVDL
jgi:hypothetical protein